MVCCIFLLPNIDEVAVDNFIRDYTPSICLQENKRKQKNLLRCQWARRHFLACGLDYKCTDSPWILQASLRRYGSPCFSSTSSFLSPYSYMHITA